MLPVRTNHLLLPERCVFKGHYKMRFKWDDDAMRSLSEHIDREAG